MTLDLRPLTLGELLDRSFRLFRRHFSLFVGLMAVPSVLVLLVNVALLIVPELAPAADVADEGPDAAALATALVGGVLIFFLAVLYLVAYMVTLGATTIAVSELYLDRSPTIASAYSHVQGHIGSLILLMILLGLRLVGVFLATMTPFVLLAIMVAFTGGVGSAVGAGLVVLGLVPAMLAAFAFSLRYSVAVPALVLEPITANGAVRRSVFLVRENFWRTAILVVFATIIATAANLIFQMPFHIGAFATGPDSAASFWWQLAGSISGAVGGAVTGPLMIVALAVLYYDLRIRKEGLDVEIMMARLGPHPPPQTTPTVTAAG